MNPIQIAIVAFVVIVILLTLGYYWYDDAKFKRKVENNFNQATDDALVADNKPMVFDSIDASQEKNSSFMPKDVAAKPSISSDPLLGDIKDDHHINELPLNHQDEVKTPPVPEDSAEAFFVKLDQIDFPFAKGVNKDFDLVVDIVFEESKKLKVLPEITQFTPKYFVFYVLDKDNIWHVFEKGKKYSANALKLVLQLVDQEGVISQAQIANVYNELHKFVVNNDAHIRCSDYELSMKDIQEQMKLLNNIELILELYILTKEKSPYSLLEKFFSANQCTTNQGVINYIESGDILFTIADEKQGLLSANGEYNMLSITAKLHLHEKPLSVLDKIFDLVEKFMAQFEARALTTNKQVIGQKEYDQLYNFVKNYAESAQKKQIHLGGALLKRLFEK